MLFGSANPISRLSSTVDSVIIAVAGGMLCLPFLHSVYWVGDEGWLIDGALHLISGKALYKDFFEFHPPIAFLATQLWLMLTGNSLAGARVLVVLLMAGISFLTFLLCVRVSKSRPVSAALTSIWALSSQGAWTVLDHHWFTTLFSLITFLCLLPGHSKRIHPFFCGFAAGASALTTSNRGALVVIVAFLTILGRRDKVDTWKYISGGASISALVFLYLLANGSVSAAYQDIIVFTATRYVGHVGIESVPFGNGTTIQYLAAVLVFPIAGLLATLVVLQGGLLVFREYNFNAALAFAVAGLLGSFPRADSVHLLFAAPLLLPLLAICLTRIAQSRWQAQAVTAALLGLMFTSSLGYYRALKDTINASPVDTSAGPVRIVRGDVDIGLLKRMSAIGIGQRALFYPYDPLLAFLTGDEQVTSLDVFLPQQNTPAQYADACIETVERAGWIVIDRGWSSAHFRQIFPSMTNPEPPEKVQFERAIESDSDVVGIYGDYELRKKVSSDESPCANIRRLPDAG